VLLAGKVVVDVLLSAAWNGGPGFSNKTLGEVRPQSGNGRQRPGESRNMEVCGSSMPFFDMQDNRFLSAR
jgi:hypothetical protein